MVDVLKELEALRQNLLDLSLRNNLLNYRPSQKRTVSIADRTPEEIYKLFVLQEKSMRFRSKTRSRKGNKTDEGEEIEDDVQENENGLLRTIGKFLASEEKNKPLNSRSGAFLEIPDDSETLDRKLFYVFNQANSIFEEQGYPVLYLAVGFLQWSEIKSSVKNPKAPLLLIPIELKRIGKGRNFTIQWTGDEIFTSITLQAKMKEFGIQIPDFEMPEEEAGVEEYFKAVSAAIRGRNDCKVLPEVYLDLFNFRKFVMYKDLDPATWPEDMSPAEHPLIQKIFNPQDPECEFSGFQEEEVDLKLSAKDTYLIMDADSSQIAVIEDVKAGKDLVVEGPPGTGKSQTIANTIAELIAHGKSVLFVSEKMAALQVVKGRLDAAGLGELCLEIHSNQTRKKAVLEELEKTLNREAPATISPDRDINELENLKHELNEYALSLGEPAGKLYPSLYTLYGLREKTRAYFEAKGLKIPRYELQEPETWKPEAWTEAESVLEKLGQVLSTLGPARKNPWYGCEPGLVLPSDLGEIELLIDECAAAFQALDAAIKNLNELSATSRPNTLEEIAAVIDAAKLLENSKPLLVKMLENEAWESDPSRIEAEALVSRLRQYTELKTFVDKTFHPSIFKLDTSEFLDLSCKFLKFIYPRYWKLKKEILSCYVSGAPSQNNRILLDLACLSECKACRQELERAGTKGKKYFLDCWKGIESDPALLDECCRLIPPFRKHLKENIFTDRSFKLIGNGVDSAALESAINEVEAEKQVFLQSLEKVGIRIKADFGKIFGSSPETAKLNQLKSRVTRWKAETSSLVLWSQYLEYKQACLKTKAAPMLEDIEAGKIEACDMIPAFEENYTEILLHRALRKRPALSTFIRELHEGKISKFTELDKRVLLENRKRIVCCAYKETPKLASGASRASEAGILLNELNRKRGHMPIRALMKKAGGLVQKIKPCFLMSPLSIAQYLDPRSTRFDVIIFDEASQVRPEDAVGALLRGKQVVVMGDSKQLPPTDFFDAVLDSPEREPEEFAAAGDMESILNVCKRSFPVKTLRWHYRSRHESLIAISNQEFYDNRLYVYPSPMQKDERLGLKFVYLPDTVYDRGKSGANRLEARAVAKAVLAHYRKYPEKSLGVGTFNIKQQEAIQEEIEALRKANPGFDLNSKNETGERFFVKNLETIQGDERDVIFLSVGFGLDSSRKLSLNFGPLNRDGGERRLNVLITRAREKCVVFSNFTSRDLVLDDNSAFGLKSLKVFLEFAESGKLPLPACSREDFDSPFEETISNFLIENGCEVHRQIGCAGYRLDLAIPDPCHQGRYVLGIECDGKSYYSSRVARDRDRLRQQVLEGLGWKIYRVWSTDWYLHPKESKEKLLETVKDTVEQAKMQEKAELEPQILSINEPSAWAEQANRSPADKLAGLPAQPFLPLSQPGDPLSPANWPADPFSVVESVESEIAENLEAEFIEAEPLTGISFEAEAEEPYSGPPLELEEGQTDSSDEDFLPEMTSKAESLALLADENSRKKPVRRTGKSKLLKFNADPCFEKINTSELIPEPEPEKISFYQAYPEIDFSAGAEKKRRPKRLNEFEYIYGSERYFEPEPYPEEDNYTGAGWNSKPEIKPETKPETEPEIDTGLKFETGSELRDLGEKKSEKLSGKNNPLEAAVPLYRTCPPSELPQFGELSELSDAKLEEAVIRIIEYEGPIHSEVLLQRIKAHTGVPRMLGKAKQRIIDAAASAESSGKVRIEGEFYWPASGSACLLRRRDGDASAKIEWICDEEIKEAVRFVLNSQYSTPLEDLIVQTSRVLGIKSTRKNTWERIEKLVQSGIESNELTLMPNEMIYFVE
jgi:superfamily I DNA and/or RNA helicase/very-short-patch-repair endonuclease